MNYCSLCTITKHHLIWYSSKHWKNDNLKWFPKARHSRDKHFTLYQTYKGMFVFMWGATKKWGEAQWRSHRFFIKSSCNEIISWNDNSIEMITQKNMNQPIFIYIFLHFKSINEYEGKLNSLVSWIYFFYFPDP